MKIRNGFVSNSSASSFLCQISLEHLAGSDSDYEEGTCRCRDCHSQFLSEYLRKVDIKTLSKEEVSKALKSLYVTINPEDSEEDLKEMLQDKVELWQGCSYTIHVTSVFCPICNMEQFKVVDLLAFALKQLGKTEEELTKDIAANYKNYADFKKYLG
jgi:hypothetical protein